MILLNKILIVFCFVYKLKVLDTISLRIVKIYFNFITKIIELDQITFLLHYS